MGKMKREGRVGARDIKEEFSSENSRS